MASDELIALDGCTFFYSDPNGDLEAEGGEGLFYQDVRHLSRWLLLVDGEGVEALTSRLVDYYSARIVCTRGAAPGDAPTLAIRRDRFVSEGVHEDVVLENLTGEEQSVRLEFVFGSDFADVLEAQERGRNTEGRQWQEVGARTVTLWSERDGYRRGTALTFSRRGRLTGRAVTFALQLRPRARWALCVDMTPIVDGGAGRRCCAAGPSTRTRRRCR